MIIKANEITKLNFDMFAALHAKQLEAARKRDYSHLSAADGLVRAGQDYYEYLRDVFFGQVHGVIYIFEADGSYVSAVCFEPYRDGVLLDSLITGSDHRRKGYAEKLLSCALKQFCGRPVYSHIHERNTASVRLHEKLGFTCIYAYAHMLDGTVRSDHFTYIKNK